MRLITEEYLLEAFCLNRIDNDFFDMSSYYFDGVERAVVREYYQGGRKNHFSTFSMVYKKDGTISRLINIQRDMRREPLIPNNECKFIKIMIGLVEEVTRLKNGNLRN
jgi:hypothetical protein